MRTKEEFDAAFRTFFEGCQRITNNASTVKKEFSFVAGPRFVKVVVAGAAHCFVEKATGDVLKAASWSAPAKHARGNIFDAYNGLKGMGPYGPAYLR